MAPILTVLFGCCLRARSPSLDDPDENTPFIAPAEDVAPYVPRNYSIDHQKMKERLGHIVRSKEGKMVNVNQKLPFNMHNRPTYRQDRSTNPSPESPSTSAFPHHHRRTHSRDPSPSIQTSRSTSSLHPGDASYLPPEADPDGIVRKPILNLRLIRGHGGFTTGGRIRQGRSTVRGRRGRWGEERATDSSEEPDAAVGPSRGRTGLGDGAEEPVLEVESPSTPGDASQDRVDAGRRAALLAAQFKIEDVGNISQSWGE
ncbi:uncharacterized protein BXZ73DRAFT_42919 [Epithele typhae]|uniref:uncharacterized protein n=1 Tax=Epithele typhae TaxID=378194 RepID=UPI002008C105|nr:uncharacterized protein BXZ73DRAFT_42919 [Epithele typhae]KAH9940376.1 hypothetical protein BXZ73DRAFT_42919 [Epithele typhae]